MFFFNLSNFAQQLGFGPQMMSRYGAPSQEQQQQQQQQQQQDAAFFPPAQLAPSDSPASGILSKVMAYRPYGGTQNPAW